MSQSILTALAERAADTSRTSRSCDSAIDRVLGNCDLLDVIFGLLPQRSSLKDRTLAASTCKLYAKYRPVLRRERLVSLAKFAQSNERFFSAVQCMRQLVRSMVNDELAPPLSRDVRLLFAESYRSAARQHRDRLDELQQAEDSQRANGTPSELLRVVASHRRHLFSRLRDLVEDMIALIDAALLPRARPARKADEPHSRAHRFARDCDGPRYVSSSCEADRRDEEVFHLKLRGDGLRWLAEQSHHATANAHGTAVRRGHAARGAAAGYPRGAEAAYTEALALADRHCLPWGTTRLGCANNYALLLVETLGRHREGQALAREAFDRVDTTRGKEEGGAQCERLTMIVQGLRVNIRTWAEEYPEVTAPPRAVDDSILDYRDYPRVDVKWRWRGVI